MTTYFWDTSALIKRYVTETGTGWVRKLITLSAGHSHMLSQITSVELASALARRIREGSIPERTARAAHLLFQRHVRREYAVLPLTDEVVEQAVGLSYQHPLRAYDAVQLASAIVLNQRLTRQGLESLVFLSGDTRLLKVSSAVGLVTDNPNDH